MNHIYRLVWSKAAQALVAVAEVVKASGGGGGTLVDARASLPARLSLLALALAAVPAWALDAGALPKGGQVSAGSASISQSGNALTVLQGSQRAAIDWQSFNIGKQATVNFVQPSASAVALNRISGNEASQIYGQLNANGQVFFSNPNGMLFASGAQVNVGGLLATTLGLGNDDFMNGNWRFTGAGAGSIRNEGLISAAGSVVLAGNSVENAGQISATTVSLLAGNTVALDLTGDGLIRARVDDAAMSASVRNSGSIDATASVTLSAGQARGALDRVVNNAGVIRASGLRQEGGEVLLEGAMVANSGSIRSGGAKGGGSIRLLGDMKDGRAEVGGTLDASATGQGNGGFIETSAATVQVADGVRVSTLAASGQNGTWLVDPTDFTVAVTGGNITGATLTTQLSGGNVQLQSSNGTTGTSGNININDTVSWSANKLTLTALNNINLNATLRGSGTASLALEYGQGAVASGNTSTYNVAAPVNLPAGPNFSTKLGSDGSTLVFTVINSLGSAGDELSAGHNTLQGLGYTGNLNGRFALGSDIDATATSGWNAGAGFAPIGNSVNKFSGTLDGLGHTVRNLNINRTAEDYVGLIGYLTWAGKVGAGIRNLGVDNASVSGHLFVGGLVGKSEDWIDSSWVTNGSISGSSVVGGVVGFANSIISNSHSTSSVDGTGTVGGLVGQTSSATISKSYATGDVTATNNTAGGLVGFNYVTSITDSYASGAVSGTNNVGGLAGSNVGGSTITNSYAMGAVNGTDFVGGLVGDNAYGVINTSYATGKVTGTSNTNGLAGTSVVGQGSATNSYWDADTTGVSSSTFGTAIYSKSAPITSYNQATYAGFDFSNKWWISEGNTRPILRSEYSTSITNAHQLQLMAMDLTAQYTIKNAIDASASDVRISPSDVWGSAGFVPIGGGGTAAEFTGMLDGAGNTVSNLFLKTAGDNVGLIGKMGTAGKVKDVGLLLEEINTTSRSNVGGLIGANAGTVMRSYAIGNFTSGTAVGGLVGLNQGGSIDQSYAGGNVTASSNMGGGLVGSNSSGAISNSYATSTVISGDSGGGLVGTLSGGSIQNSYSSGTGGSTGSSKGGNLIGHALAGSSIVNSFASVNPITGGNPSPFIGVNDGATITSSSAKTDQQLKTLSTFSGWDITRTGGDAAVWRIYEGRTNPLLRNLMTQLTLADAPDVSRTYNGSAQSGSTTSNTNVLGTAATGTGAGFYNGYYSNQAGYDIVGGNLTINPATLTVTAAANNKVYDGTSAATLASLSSSKFGTDDVTVSSTSTSFSDANVGNAKTVTVGGLSISGSAAGNYTLGSSSASTTANITQLSSVAWTGSGGNANWSNPANWAGGATPTRANVANVSLPSSGTINYDLGGVDAATLSSLSSAANLNLASGTLTLNGPASTYGLSLTGGTLNGNGALTVTNNFSRSAGAVGSSFSSVNITQATGNLAPGAWTVAGPLSLTATAGSVSLADNLSSSGALTIRAGSDIALSGSAALSSNGGDILLRSNTAGLGSGAISATAGTSISSNGGSITLGGGSGTPLGYAVGNVGSNNGIDIMGTVNAAGGNILMQGQGMANTANAKGIYIHGGAQVTTTAAGTISINGKVSGTGDSAFAISIDSVDSASPKTSVTSQNGAINLNGDASAGTGFNDVGVLVFEGAHVGATGTGSLSAVGDGPATAAGSSRGVDIENGASVSTNTGSLTLTGTSHATAPGTGVNFGVHVNGNATVQSNSGSITLIGTGSQGSQGIEVNPHAYPGTASSVTSGSGNILLRSLAGTGIGLVDATINTTGNVTLDASGGGNVSQTTASSPASSKILASGLELLGSGASFSLTSGNNSVGVVAGNTGSVNLTDNAGNWSIGTVNTAGLAASGALTINTSGTVTQAAGAPLSAGTFTLGSGTWSQVGPSLPSFSANDFRLVNSGVFTRALGGDGSTASPYQLTDLYGLQGMSTRPASSYVLANNIDAAPTASWNTSVGFMPIGGFSGVLDGQGHTISNLRINTTDSAVGLIGQTTASATIKNIGLVGGDIVAWGNVGALVGSNAGTILNSYSSALVRARTAGSTGGLVGVNSGSITGSYALGEVNGGPSGSFAGVGGLVGFNTGSVTGSFATGPVVGGGGSYFNYAGGGLVGYNDGGSVSNSYSTGNVSNNGNAAAAGLVGYNGGTVSNSYSTGSANASSGLIGYGGGTVTSSYWDMTTSGLSTSAGGTGLTSTQMKQLASFSGWSIDATGGAGQTWRIYEGHTAPLLTSFMTRLTLADAPDATVTYNGAAQSGNSTTTPGVLGTAATGTNVGFYNGYYSTQLGYNLTGGNLTISAMPISTISLSGTRVYDGTDIVNADIFGLSGLVGSQTLVLTGSGTVADKNVGVNKPVTLGSLTLNNGTNGGLASNYTLVGGTHKATITARDLTVSATATDKIYDATRTASVTLSSNKVAGDVLTLSDTAELFDTKNVGTGKTVTVSGIGISGTDVGNYRLLNTTATTTASITARDLTVSATAGNKTYDGNRNASVTLSDNRVSGDVLTLTDTSALFDTKNAGTGKTVTVSGIGISGTDVGNYHLLNTTTTATANISKRDLTVSATASNKTYDGNANASVTLSDNRVSGDVLTVSDASATFDNKNVGTGKTVTVSGIGISGTEALNYNLLNTSATNTANITQLDTVTWIGTSPGSGNWLTPGNWAGGAVPDGANVAKVVIGAGVNVTFDSGSTQLTQLTSASNITLNGGNLTLGLLRSDASLVNGGATLTVNGGALNVNGSLQADVLRLTTGSVGGTGNLTSPNFAMSGATLSGTLANLTLGSVGNFSISSPLAATQSLSLTSNGGAILDALPTGTSASLTAPVVNLTAATGIGAAAQPLRLATNDITANTTGGDIRLNNTPAPGRVLLRAAVTGNASPVIYMQNGQALQITGRLRSEGGAIIIDPPTTLSMDPTSSIVTPGGSITLESSSDMLLAALSTGSTGSINLNSSGGTIGTATPGVNNITTGSLTVAANGDVQLAYVADTVDSTGVRGRLSTPDGALPALTSDVPPVKDSLPDTTPASTTPIAAAPPDPGSTSTVAGATLTVGGTTLRKTLDELVKTDKTKGSALICR